MIVDPLQRPVGILILDTAFERMPGDAGNADTWRFPVIYRTVRDASTLRVIDGEAQGLLDAFITAGRELIDVGCAAITTTCGFLSLYQDELSAALSVPVATSSLLQIPVVERLLSPNQAVGVITMDAARLTPRHLRAVGVDHDVAMEGLPRDGTFWRMIATDSSVDHAVLQDEVIEAGERLLKRRSDIGAFVLECTNMPPYSIALSRRFGLPVFDIVTMVNWLAAAIAPQNHLAR